MDTKLQTLVRKAVTGDMEAQNQLFTEKRRSGQLYTEIPTKISIKYGEADLNILNDQTLTLNVLRANQWREVPDEEKTSPTGTRDINFDPQVFKLQDDFWIHIPHSSGSRDSKEYVDYSGYMAGNDATNRKIITMLSIKLNQEFADREKFSLLAAVAENNRKIAMAMQWLVEAEQTVEKMTNNLGDLFLEQAKL